MSCNMDLVEWMEECYSDHDIFSSVTRESEPETETENENSILSLNNDIERITKERDIERISKKKNIPEKINFSSQYKTIKRPHLPHGYKLTFKTTFKTSKRTVQINDVAMLCTYDPKKNKNNIMCEIDEDNHFTMNIPDFEKYISNKEIIIEKITF